MHVPAQVWHLTYRCHHRRFLRKFARDRPLWRAWLCVARKGYGLMVLDYTATSNHVHVVVRDQGRGTIAASVQLIEGCTGQAYKRRRAAQST